MSFSHSAYSTMNTNLAKEVLNARMMPQRFQRKEQRAGKTSSHTRNVNLQAVRLPSLLAATTGVLLRCYCSGAWRRC